MFEAGYLKLRGRGVALRLHWSIPLAGLLLTRFHLSVGAWLGFFFVLGVHVAGHVAMAALCGARVAQIDVHGLGGHCGTVGLSRSKRMLVAAGGILAQVALALLVVLVLQSYADSALESELLSMLVGPSLALAALNVLPIAPLDGASFWSTPRTVADMEDEPESFDHPAPQRANPNPPKRDWFARAKAKAGRARAAKDSDQLDADDAGEPELSPEAADSVDRLFEKMRDNLKK
jgi:hypothetical protein